MNREFNQYANQLIQDLPSNQGYTIQYLLYNALQSLTSITILLEQVFLMIDIIITIVAAYVVYILLTNSLKDRVY